jgi:hypothetical protein
MNIEDLTLGHFDMIGEFTAKKKRDPGTELYSNVGAFFRPNYERGIMIYSLIKKYNLESFLEIGFGRGYGSFCAAMAFSELGKGTVTTVDPNLDQAQIEGLTKMFPSDWFKRINFCRDTSDNFFKNPEAENAKFDLIYLDGDHRYDFVKRDWENSKDRYNKFLIFDDYHLPTKSDKDIEVAAVVDYIDDDSKELIIMDRRIFVCDRGCTDEQIDYGQVLLTR